MSTEVGGPLAKWYQRRIGDAVTGDEIAGYWLFFIGVICGLVGVAVFTVTDAATAGRGIAYAITGLAPGFIMLGAVLRLPLRRTATLLAGGGWAISVIGIIWFLLVFPAGWSTATGHLGVIATYSAGILLLGIAGAFVPLITDPIREDYGRLQEEVTQTAAERDEEKARAGALEAQLAGLQASKARFELYEDAGGKWRWRLRHRNTNVIADSGEGYSTKQKCQQGIGSVRRNALGAGTLQVESKAADDVADAEEPAAAIPTETEAESRAAFELYEDNAGEWRWRLRHENGNILADSGEGYASRSNLNRAVETVSDHLAAASYLEIDPVAFETYQDAAGEWRWRLLHRNGEILADSGEGYATRGSARRGVESVREALADAEVSEQ